MANRRFTLNSVTSVVRFLRLYYGLSQQKLAELSGLRFADIYHLEHRHQNIQILKAIKLARFFDVSVHAIVKNSFTSVMDTLPPQPVVNLEAQARKRKSRERREQIGVKGEQIVAQRERDRLAGTLYAKGVNPNYADEESSGFDILSFTLEGKPLYIEVKTTLGHKKTFFISVNEMKFMEFCLSAEIPYELHWVYNLNSPKGYKVKVFTAQDLKKLRFIPTKYKVKGV